MASNRRFRKSSESSSRRPRTDKPRTDDRGSKPDDRRMRDDSVRSFGGKKRFSKERGAGKPGESTGQRRHDGPPGRKSFGKRMDRDDSNRQGDKPTFPRGYARRKDDAPGRGKPFGSKSPENAPPRSFEGSKGPGPRKFTRDSESRGQKPFYKQGFGRKKLETGRDRGEAKPFLPKSSDRPERKSFVESRLERKKPSSKHRRHELPAKPADGLIRLNKYISNSGVCSRREADNLIAMGLITVNGKAVTELGHKVKASDDVRYEGRRLTAERMVYILMNKPKGVITTTDDPQDRNTVMHLIKGACKERVYPVGRLDRNTSGLLLLTNDGELTDKLTHPSYNVKKIYKAELDKPLTKADFQKIRDGVRLEEGVARVDDLAVISDDGKTIGIEIHIGWNRVIRRIFEVLGYEVVKLDRSVYASLDKKDVPRGHWRFLRDEEVIRLKHFQ